MKYLHTMIRVVDLERSLRFYTEGLGFEIVSRQDYEKDRFSLVFLRSRGDGGAHGRSAGDSAPGPAPDRSAMIELTHNWDTKEYDRGNAYGHVAYQVESIDAVQAKLKAAGYDLSWGPGLTPNGKTRMAFVDDPDGYEIELLEYR